MKQKKPINRYSVKWHRGLEKNLNLLLREKLVGYLSDLGPFLVEIDEDTPQRVLNSPYDIRVMNAYPFVIESKRQIGGSKPVFSKYQKDYEKLCLARNFPYIRLIFHLDRKTKMLKKIEAQKFVRNSSEPFSFIERALKEDMNCEYLLEWMASDLTREVKRMYKK